MQIKNIFTAVNSTTRVNKLKFQIRGCSSITSSCFGGNLNRGLNKLCNLNTITTNDNNNNELAEFESNKVHYKTLEQYSTLTKY